MLCVRSDCRQPLKPEFVLGTSVARLALPLYVYACPSNLLRVQPNLTLCAGLVAYVGLQCGLLLAQHWWGPRCFIPKQARNTVGAAQMCSLPASLANKGGECRMQQALH